MVAEWSIYTQKVTYNLPLTLGSTRTQNLVFVLIMRETILFKSV